MILNICNLIINDIAEAEAIAHGDKTFAVTPVETNIKVGDCIHYLYDNNQEYIKHEVDEHIYDVVYMEEFDGLKVFCIKPVTSWRYYVHNLIKEAYMKELDCHVRFYGTNRLDEVHVRRYAGNTVEFADDYGATILRKVSDIASIDLLS